MSPLPRASRRAAAYVGAVREGLYWARATGAYPIGLSSRLCDALGSAHVPRVDPAAQRTYPVLFVHGMGHNASWSLTMERALRASGFRVHAGNWRTYGPDRSIFTIGGEVAEAIAAYAETEHVEKVHVVAHSLGGLVLRSAVAYHGAGPQVSAAITLGSPHTGSPLSMPRVGRTWLARSIMGQLGVEMAQGSAALLALDAAATAGTAHWAALYSNLDEVVPGLHGRLDVPALAARNVLIRDVGHMGLALAPRVCAAVADLVAAIDAQELQDAVQRSPTAPAVT